MVLATIKLPRDIESDIRNSVFTGMEVTAHERAVDFFGSSQVGYIVLNPETGAGGYLIGGGENGAFLIMFGLSALLLFGVFSFVSGGVGPLFALAFINAAVANIAAGVSLLAKALGQNAISTFACNLMWIALGAVLASVVAAFTVLGPVASTVLGEVFSVSALFAGC